MTVTPKLLVIEVEPTLANYFKGTLLRIHAPLSYILFGGSSLLFIIAGETEMIFIPLFISLVLILSVSLFKFNKAHRMGISSFKCEFTSDEFSIEVPGKGKVSVKKDVIKKVSCYKTFALIRFKTTSFTQPVLVTPNQSKKLKEFLHNNGYSV